MDTFKICIPLKKPSLGHLTKAEQAGDLVELWADEISQKALITCIKAAHKPVVVTCKDSSERGQFTGGGGAKIELLQVAAEAGASYIDCGSQLSAPLIKRLRNSLAKTGAKLILSTHFWSKTPSIDVLEKHAKELTKRGADVIKIATAIKTPLDTVTLFELSNRLKAQKIPFIIVGMGENSRVARIGCAVLGGEFTFAALSQKYTTAPGQLTVSDLRGIC